jgi:uncharacterized protein YndB with AHSA1/START domain
MTIAPIVKTVTVKAPPQRAFEIFAGQMGAWWPKNFTIAASPPVEVVIEGRPEGRWYERSADGVETPWGRVLAWSPPGRLLLAWQIDATFTYDPNFETELELTFAPEGEGTRVTLEHRNFERFGESAAKMVEMLGGGWPGIMDGFAAYAEKH